MFCDLGHACTLYLVVLFLGIIVKPQCSSPIHATHPRYARTMLSRISNAIIVKPQCSSPLQCMLLCPRYAKSMLS